MGCYRIPVKQRLKRSLTGALTGFKERHRAHSHSTDPPSPGMPRDVIDRHGRAGQFLVVVAYTFWPVQPTSSGILSLQFPSGNHDAGLLAVDRGESTAQSFLTATLQESGVLRTTAPVVAQAWRDGSRQARLAKFLETVEVHDFTLADASTVGGLLRQSQTSDVVDAHIVALALHLDDSILTADTPDYSALTSHLSPRAPHMHHWP